MEEMNVKLAIFEGPLDLLLHLLNELELDIYEIPIAEITEQYLTYLHAMKHLELEVAGEYVVMAATLMAMKSRMLLPTEEYDEEEFFDAFEEDPREQLIAQLVEYKKYKQAAQTLSDLALARGEYFHTEPLDLEGYQEETPELVANQVNTIDLFLAFHQLLEKKKKRQKIEASIAKDETTVDEKMDWIKTQLQSHAYGQSLESFLVTGTKEELVTTFMALLELMKYQQIKVQQTAHYDEIKIYPGEHYDES